MSILLDRLDFSTMCDLIGPLCTLGSELFQAQSSLKYGHDFNTKHILLVTQETDRNTFAAFAVYPVRKSIIKYTSMLKETPLPIPGIVP